MAVDRGYFISHNPYEDRPQSIGYSATISAPHMVIFAHVHRVVAISSVSIWLFIYFHLSMHIH